MISKIIFLLFFPASLGILRQVILSPQLTHQLLGFGIFLFCIEQANMANQDLRQVINAQRQIQDARLDIFQRVTVITIILELIGFYLSSIYLASGSLVILLGLILFNLFANIKIHNSANHIIKDWNITERLPVLIADIVGLILVSMWMLNIASNWISWGLFAMALVFCGIKLFLYFKSFNFLKEV